VRKIYGISAAAATGTFKVKKVGSQTAQTVLPSSKNTPQDTSLKPDNAHDDQEDDESASIYDKIRSIADTSRALYGDRSALSGGGDDDPMHTMIEDAVAQAEQQEEAERDRQRRREQRGRDREEARKQQRTSSDGGDNNAVENDSESDSDDDEEEGDARVDPTTYEASPSQQLILDILKRCGYFVSIPSTQVAVTVLQTISASMLRLADCKVLLYPAMHQIFPPLLGLLQEVVVTLYRSGYSSSGIRGGEGGGSDSRGENEVSTTLSERGSGSVTRSHELLTPRKTIEINKHNSALITTHKTSGSILQDVSVFDPSTHTYTKMTNSSQTATHMPNSAVNLERLHVLPPLCELFALFVLVGGDFLTLKYREELFPQLVYVLKYYHALSFDAIISGGGGGMGAKGAGGKMSLSDLIITPSVTTTTTTNSDATNTASGTTSGTSPNHNHGATSNAAHQSRFSVHSKAKLAVISLIKQIAAVGHAGRYLKTHIAVFVWYLLPCAMSGEVS
jgi:hypothetical protein